MKNKQRASTKVIISYNDGSTYTFTNVQQIDMDCTQCKVAIIQVRNKDKFICEELKTTIRFTHIKEVQYLSKDGSDTTYKVVNGVVVEKTIKEKVEIPLTYTITLTGSEGVLNFQGHNLQNRSGF